MRNEIWLYNNPTWERAYGDENMFGGISYNSCVNPDKDWKYNTISAAQLKFTLDTQIPLGTELLWKCRQLEESSYTTMGYFIVDNVEKTINGRYTHSCYDSSIRLDVDITRWFRNWLTGRFDTAFTLKDLADAIYNKIFGDPDDPVVMPVADSNANYTDVTYSGLGIAKSNGWTDTNTMPSASEIPQYTARALLGQIAEICGVFGYAPGVIGGYISDDVRLQMFCTPLSGSKVLAAYVPYTQRRQNQSRQSDDDVPFPDFVQIKTGKNVATSDTSNIADGQTVNVYEINNNIFFNPDKDSPSIEANMTTIAQNIFDAIELVGLSDLPGYTSTTTYRPCTLKCFNDKSFVYNVNTVPNNTVFSGAFAGYDTRILTSDSFYLDDEGIYHLNGNTKSIAASAFPLTSPGLYAISDTFSSNFLDPDQPQPTWSTSGKYLYVIYKGSPLELYYKIKYLLDTTTHKLMPGEVFLYDDIAYRKLYDTTEIYQTAEVLTGSITLTLATDYVINDNGDFTLAGTVSPGTSTLTNIQRWRYTIPTDAEGTIQSEDVRSGQYICALYINNNGEIEKRIVYKNSYSARQYEKRVGVVMSKSADKNGVTLECTGGNPRLTTQIFDAGSRKKTVTGSLVSITDAAANLAFDDVIANISTSSGVSSVVINRVGSNLLKTINGTYSLTGRTLTVSDGEVSCAVTGGSGSAVLVSSGVFTSSYKLPAGTYYFDPGIVSVTGQTLGSPFVRFRVNSMTYYDLGGGGTITLTTPAYIDSIRDSITHTWASGNSYVMRPKITLVSGEAFEPWQGNSYSISWGSPPGSITSGSVDFTTGVLTTGGNTYSLSPVEIKSLTSGTVNNVWADTGNVTVSYITEG